MELQRVKLLTYVRGSPPFRMRFKKIHVWQVPSTSPASGSLPFPILFRKGSKVTNNFPSLGFSQRRCEGGHSGSGFSFGDSPEQKCVRGGVQKGVLGQGLRRGIKGVRNRTVPFPLLPVTYPAIFFVKLFSLPADRPRVRYGRGLGLKRTRNVLVCPPG